MKYFHLLFYSAILSAIVSCDKDPIEPIDIFSTEELTNARNLELGQDGGLDILMVNADRVIETSSGYHIKGTIFSKSMSGTIPVTSGDFTVNTNLSAASLAKGFGALDFKGYGTANFPSAGLFSAIDFEEIPGSEVYYNTGRIFKSEAMIYHLPLLDDRYYFRYKVDKANNGREYRMKKITVRLREFYLDARDPATLFTGDIYSEKAGVKKLIVEKAAVGISANELWDFIPFTYSDNMETVTGGTGFVRMNGGISLSGIIPIKKYPLEIFGNAIINTSFGTKGPLDFFERGFDDASFRIGVNGELFFTRDLVKFLTGVDTVKLGKATLQAEFSDDSYSMRMAGEYSDNVLERFLGEDMMKFIPYNSREGILYLKATENHDDFIIYLEEKISFQIPGLGVTPVSDCVFRVTKDEVGLSGSVSLPYNIGNVKVTGIVSTDGTFLLQGTTNCNIDLGSGLNYNADLEVAISENGAKLSGTMAFPYGIGDVAVSGGILTDELYFSGKIESSLPFPVNAAVNSNLQVTISSKTGINLSGRLDLPGRIGAVNVTGSVNTAELLLTGEVKAGTGVNFGNIDINSKTALSLTASSRTGVYLTGVVTLPFAFGDASVTAKVTGSGLLMTGNLGSKIGIPGYPLFSADMSMTASSGSGLYLSGQMKFPGNFGWTGVSGYVSNYGYDLTGNISSASIDFGIVTLDTKFSMVITNHLGVQTSAKGEGCVNVAVDKVCATVDVGVAIDYNNNSVKLCMNFPVAGSACAGW